MITRKAKHGMSSTIYTLIIVAILVLLNILGNNHKIVKDMTEEKFFTLSEQTLKIIKGINEPVHIKGFFTQSNTDITYIKMILEQYVHESEKLEFEIFDPDVFPSLANSYSVTKDGTLVFDTLNNKIQITDLSEQGITSGIIKVLSKEQKRVAYISGHGEASFEPHEQRSCSKLIKYLKNDNFKVENIIITKGKVDLSIFDLVLISGPYRDYLDEELLILKDYMDKGGRMLILIDPFPSFGFTDFLEPWNIKVGKGIVIDTSSYYWTDIATPAVYNYPEGTITQNLPLTFYPHARSLSIIDNYNRDISIKSLVNSSAKSWAETSPKDIEYNEDIDFKGPIAIAYLAEKNIETKANSIDGNIKSKLIVFGDSDFVIDHFIDTLGNKDMILNCAEYLVDEEQLISIRPKQMKMRGINLSNYQFTLVKFVTMFLVPFTFIILAFFTWMKKR